MPLTNERNGRAREPFVEDHGLSELCRAALQALGASRVTVWRHALSTDSLLPSILAWRHAGDDAAEEDRFLARWAFTPTAELPPLARALAGPETVTVPDAASEGGRMPELAAEIAMRSFRCEPLVLGAPLGVVLVEPAEAADRDEPALRMLVTSVAASLAWHQADRRRAELALLLELADATGSRSLDQLLAMGCAGLARLLGVRRASVFLLEKDGRVTARMSRLADGSSDGGTWDRLCRKGAPPALVEAVMDTRGTVQASAPSSPLLADEWATSLGIASALGVPLGDRGVFILDTDRQRCFSDEHVRLAAGAAAQLAGGVRREWTDGDREQRLATATALRQLLEAGVRACSPMEAAQALASTASAVLGVPIACAYLVGDDGRIVEVATVGADRARTEALRSKIIGASAAGSPVWQRTVEGPSPGPDLIADTAVAGVVRPGGVAQTLGLRSLATIPLLSSDGPLGLVLCGDPAPRRRWLEGDRELLAQLALEGTIVVDNARLRQAERHEATHDALTGLLNRKAFSDHLALALAQAERIRQPLAVLLLDLDRFKEVNDRLGHHRGDELLVAVAGRLTAALREGDVIARLGGDEFAVVLTSAGDVAGAEMVARRIEAELEEPVNLGSCALHVEASVGIACFPGHGKDAEALLQRADAAMYGAKRSGRGRCVYRPGFDDGEPDELALLAELRHGLEAGELELHYQPKFDLQTGGLSGLEALARWVHPRLGLLRAAHFVPMAEETGLIRALTAWAVPAALSQLRAWRSLGLTLPLAVNVSPRDTVDPDLVEKVAGWLSESGLPGDSLVLEVPAGALGADVAAGSNLRDLRELGVKVSLDHFGSGTSSLAHLDCSEVDEVKISRALLGAGAARRSILRSIVGLGHDLGMRVAAEGVETEESLAYLRSIGCDEAQGAHLGRPLSPGELEPLLLGWASEDGWGSAAASG
ncbi:MAG: putative bifunctional diguanylate cyclase/phosphodiesterase [Acidimicrobiales bacterium]